MVTMPSFDDMCDKFSAALVDILRIAAIDRSVSQISGRLPQQLSEAYWLLYIPPALALKLPRCAHRVYICIPYGSHNKQRPFP
jgi:hypothetical protein